MSSWSWSSRSNSKYLSEVLLIYGRHFLGWFLWWHFLSKVQGLWRAHWRFHFRHIILLLTDTHTHAHNKFTAIFQVYLYSLPSVVSCRSPPIVLQRSPPVVVPRSCHQRPPHISKESYGGRWSSVITTLVPFLTRKHETWNYTMNGIFLITSRNVSQFKRKFQTVWLKECWIYTTENNFC